MMKIRRYKASLYTLLTPSWGPMGQLDFTHICCGFDNAAIYALYLESSCVKFLKFGIFLFFSDPGIRIMIMMGWCCRRDIEMMWSWSSVFDSQSGGTDGRGISTFFSGFLRAIWIFLRAIWMTCHKLISLDKSTSSSPAERRRRRRGETRSENQHEHWKRLSFKWQKKLSGTRHLFCYWAFVVFQPYSLQTKTC